MPTVAELQIVLEAQDRASAQLRRLGGEVQRLEQQVSRAGGRGGEGLLGGLLQGGGIGAGFAAVQGALRGVQGVFDLIGDSIFGMNARLERATAQFTIFTGSASEAQRVIQQLRREADITPFNTEEVIAAGASLSSVARAANTDLLDLVRTAEALAASQPSQGLEGAAFALREAVLGGDFQSVIDRFNLSRVTINRLREEGVPALEAVKVAMREVGATREQVEAFGRTFEGRQATVLSFFDELRQRLGAGLFEQASEQLGRLVNAIATYGDRLRAIASDIGAALGAIAARVGQFVTGPIRALLDAFAPGLWDEIAASMAAPAQAMERTAEAAQQAAPAVESVGLRLGRLGVAAATLQQEAERVRRTYDDQLEPLERQLRLLQRSEDVQRVQNQLATNRATVEGLRLDQEIAALQAAAGGAEDPAAAGLTVRQRAIALALQERRLRQEELGLEEQRRPLIQSLEQQIAAIQEQQRQALAPLERQLAVYREQIGALQVVRQEADLAKQAEQERAQAIRDTGRGQATPEALEDSRQRGEAVVQRFLDGYTKWLDANGGTLWTALIASYQKWLNEGGGERLTQVGTEMATFVGKAFAATLGAVIKNTLFPAGMPRVEGQFDPAASLPRVTTTPAGPGATGETSITVNVGDVVAADPGLVDRLRLAIHEAILAVVTASAQVATGPQQPLPGNLR